MNETSILIGKISKNKNQLGGDNVRNTLRSRGKKGTLPSILYLANWSAVSTVNGHHSLAAIDKR